MASKEKPAEAPEDVKEAPGKTDSPQESSAQGEGKNQKKERALSPMEQNLRISEMLRQQSQTMSVEALMGENQKLKIQLKRLQAQVQGQQPQPNGPVI